MNHLMEQIFFVANKVSASSEEKGMASIEVRYNPYESRWESAVTWSDNSRVSTQGSDMEASLWNLLVEVLTYFLLGGE